MVFINACTAPPEDLDRVAVENSAEPANDEQEIAENEGLTKVAADPNKSSFEFEGYGPGKSHVGTFEEGEMFFLYDNNELVGFVGVINPATVKTDSGGLDKHLMNEDFFNVETFPKITATSTNIDKVAGQVTGDLTFLGVTKELTFPATITDNSVEADVVFDTTLWGMEYAGVNPEVRVAFNFVAQE